MSVMMRARVNVGVLALCLTVPASAGQVSPGNAVARTEDGAPDLSGFWQVLNSAAWNIQDHSAQPGIPAGQGVADGNDIPYQSWALKQKQENVANRATVDPEAKCYLPGVPRLTYAGAMHDLLHGAFRIVQTRDHVLILGEENYGFRSIPLDGRPHLGGELTLWMGDSRGHWEGDTLVVDVRNSNGKPRLDMVGNFYGPGVHLVERFTRAGSDAFDYEVTVDDPAVYTRPWKLAARFIRAYADDYEFLEDACHEGEQSADKMLLNR